MRRILVVLTSCVVVLTASTWAQSAQQPATTFRSGVSLVTVDVTVVDKDGRPVPGLTADDIEIKLNGKAQPIRALVYLTAGGPQAATPPAGGAAASTAASAAPAMPAPAPPAMNIAPPDTPRRTVSNAGAPSAASAAAGAPAPAAAAAPAKAAAAPAVESRVFVILVDDLSLSPQRGKAMFAAAQRFIDRVPASDPIGFATTTGVGAVNPTRDRAVVRAALAKVVGNFNDPRGIGKSGVSPRPGCDNTPDQPLFINESIDIERGDDRLLTEVVLRECFNGDRTAMPNMSSAQMAGSCQCAHEVQSEARRVAALARQNKGRQIQGVMSVIDAMKTADGIRHLVMLTDGVPVSREVDELTPLVKAAARAGVQLSVLLEEPDMSLADEGRRALDAGVRAQADPGSARRRREDDQLLVNGAQTVTEMLGGTFYRVIGNADPSFDKVIISSSAVYRLGVELPSGTAPGKEFQLAASVKRPGLTAKANRLAVFAAPASEDRTAPAATASSVDAAKSAAAPVLQGQVPASIDDVLKAAISANTQAGDVPIRMAATVRRSTNVEGQVDVSVNLLMPGSLKGPVTTIIAILDANNNVRNNRRELPSTGGDYAVPYLFPLAPGDYRLRVAAADINGAIGTLDLPVRAQLTSLGGFTASDVLTWVVDSTNRAQLFAIEDVPSGVDELHASLELYPVGQAPSEPPVVHWTITREGEQKPIEELDTDARLASTLFRADAAFAFGTLPAGSYVVRATLMADDKPVGSKAAVVRKR